MKDFSQCMTAPSLFYSLLKPYAKAVLLMGRIVEGDKGNATGEKTLKQQLNPFLVMYCVKSHLELSAVSYVLESHVLFAVMHQMHYSIFTGKSDTYTK